MNTTAGNRHGAIEKTLAGLMASFIDTKNALAEAQRRFAALDAQDSAPDQKIGKARKEVKRLSHQLEEQQRQHRQLAQEELAARYASVEERQRQERRTAEELGERETSLTARLTLAREQLTQAEAQLNDHGTTGRRLVMGPLKAQVEGQAKEALAAATKGRKKVKELEAELAQVRDERAESTARLAFLAAGREEVLALSQTHLRVLNLKKIRAQLEDPHVTVDRIALEELLAKWDEGFTELIEPLLVLEAPHTLTFYPKEANIYYWQDTGEIAGTAIFDCPSKVGNQQWPKSLSAIAFDDPRERLEARRAGRAS